MRFANQIRWAMLLWALLLIEGRSPFAADLLSDDAGKSNRDGIVSKNPAPNPRYETKTVRGWRLYINREMLADEPQRVEKAIELLDQQLEEITRVVPKVAVNQLQEVPLYFNPEYPGKQPTAEFHPDEGWLRDNGRDVTMAKGVEFTNIRNFEAELNRMPNFALHELAHAYHDRVLPKGFENEPIAKAFARAKEAGTYDLVDRHYGNGKPDTREKAYAMTNPMEYFAESSEAYFSRNDFYPFNRGELERHDPVMFALLGELWQVGAETGADAGHAESLAIAPDLGVHQNAPCRVTAESCNANRSATCSGIPRCRCRRWPCRARRSSN